MKTIILTISVAALLLSARVESKTFDVSNCSQFRSALGQAGNQDVIQFAKGDYRCAFDTKRGGVTFRGADGYGTRLLWSSGSSGKQIIGVKHDGITLEHLAIDGEKKHNSGHGLLRVGSSKGLRIRHNHFLNSGSSHINVGGSLKRTTIRDVQITDNVLKGSGYQGEYGEAIYIGDFEGSGSVDGVIIARNEISNFTDNAIDVKPPARNVEIYHNDIRPQEERGGKEINTGTLVVQGRDVKFHDNYIRDVIPGKAVFNLVTNARVMIEDNVIQTVRGAEAWCAHGAAAVAAKRRSATIYFATRAARRCSLFPASPSPTPPSPRAPDPAKMPPSAS